MIIKLDVPELNMCIWWAVPHAIQSDKQLICYVIYLILRSISSKDGIYMSALLKIPYDLFIY